jgi:hypothetical protein
MKFVLVWLLRLSTICKKVVTVSLVFHVSLRRRGSAGRYIVLIFF